MINWDTVVDDWNGGRDSRLVRRLTGMDNPPEFDNIKDLLAWLYSRVGSTIKMSKILASTPPTLIGKMRKEGIQIKKGPNTSPSKLSTVNMTGKTISDLMKETGLSRQAISSYAISRNIRLKYKRTDGGKRKKIFTD